MSIRYDCIGFPHECICRLLSFSLVKRLEFGPAPPRGISQGPHSPQGGVKILLWEGIKRANHHLPSPSFPSSETAVKGVYIELSFLVASCPAKAHLLLGPESSKVTPSINVDLCCHRLSYHKNQYCILCNAEESRTHHLYHITLSVWCLEPSASTAFCDESRPVQPINLFKLWPLTQTRTDYINYGHWMLFKRPRNWTRIGE